MKRTLSIIALGAAIGLALDLGIAYAVLSGVPGFDRDFNQAF